MGNTQLNPDQTNTGSIGIYARAAEDLTGKRSRIGVLGVSSGVRTVALPTALTDPAAYLIDEGVAQGEDCPLSALTPGENFRVVAKGAGDAGARLVHAAPGTAADKGKLRVLPAAAGTYHVVAIAEESFVDGQLVLVRPYGPLPVTVT